MVYNYKNDAYAYRALHVGSIKSFMMLLLTTTVCNCCLILMILICFLTRILFSLLLFVSSYLLPKSLNCQEHAALELQCYIRGHLTRNLILGIMFPSFHHFIFYLIVVVIEWFSRVFHIYWVYCILLFCLFVM